MKSSSVLKQPSAYISLTGDNIHVSKEYFLKKYTSEVKYFLSKNNIKNSHLKKRILYFTGRLLNVDDVTIVGRYNSTMRDLVDSMFFVPVVEKYSPVALIILNEIHLHHQSAKHSGIETHFGT